MIKNKKAYNKRNSKNKFYIKRKSKKKSNNKHIKRNIKLSKIYDKKKKRQKVVKSSGKRIKVLDIFFNLIAFLLFTISYYFYFLSLEKCLKGQEVCSTNWDWIKLKIKQFIISAILVIFLIILIIL